MAAEEGSNAFGGLTPQHMEVFSEQADSSAEEGRTPRADVRVQALKTFGGLAGLVRSLNSNMELGLVESEEELEKRREVFGDNKLPSPPMDSWFQLFVDSFKDPILIILMVAALVSLGIGIAEDQDKGWIDGVAIWIAILIVAVVTATNDYQKQLQFKALEDASREGTKVKAYRGNKFSAQEVFLNSVVVGDVVEIEEGFNIPADGILIEGRDVATDESAVTGESDAVPHRPDNNPFLYSGTTCSSGAGRMLVVAVGAHSTEGRLVASREEEQKDTPLQEKLEVMAKYIGYFGTAAAIATFVALMIILAIQGDGEDGVGKIWYQWMLDAFIIGVTIIVVAIPEGLPLAVTISLAFSTRKMLADQNLIRKLEACETMGNATDICSDKTGTLTQNKMTIQEGFFGSWPPVTFDDSSMQIGEDLVKPTDSSSARELSNGLVAYLSEHLSSNSKADNKWVRPAKDDVELAVSRGLPEPVARRIVTGEATEAAGIVLVQSFGIDYERVREGLAEFHGAEGGDDKEVAAAGAGDGEGEGESGEGGEGAASASAKKDAVAWCLKQYPFSSSKKRMSTLVKQADGSVRLYVTGASEQILELSTQINDPASDAESVGESKELTDDDRERIVSYIEEMAGKKLRTIGLAYRTYASVDDIPAGWDAPMEENPDADVVKELIFVAVYGIKDPIRPEVPAAVADCVSAGITVRMCTGDKLETAIAIGKECGILKEGEEGAPYVIDGVEFRSLSIEELDERLHYLKVLARAKPQDKEILVRRLNGDLPSIKGDKYEEWEKAHPGAIFAEDGDRLAPGYLEEWLDKYKLEDDNGKPVQFRRVVGVTGDGSNDAPALIAADVGLAMGIAGTDVAKGAADIVILDDNFESIRKAVMWGRTVYDNIRKFLQFQLTVNVVALAITFLAAVSQREPPLNPVMMLWVNLIMDTMGALALGTEAPTDAMLQRHPYHRESNLISPSMIRHIGIQSVFQLMLLLALLYTAEDAFGINKEFLLKFGAITEGDSAAHVEEKVEEYLSTLLFNAFVFCQVFNEYNSRSITDDMNIFRGLHTNPIFTAIIIITIGLQVFIIEAGGDFTETTGLTAEHWLYTILFGLIAFPVGIIMRLVPAPERAADFASYWTAVLAKRAPPVEEVARHARERKATIAEKSVPKAVFRAASGGDLKEAAKAEEES